MDQLIVTPTLDIRRSDLSLKVDFARRFTLKDVLRAAVSSSEISSQEMSELTRCAFVQDFWEEAHNTPYEPLAEGKLNAIILTYTVETFIVDEQTRFSDTFWELSGLMRDGGFMSVNMSPTYRLSDLPIVVGKTTDWREFHKDKVREQILNFAPTMTLLELLHATYWHIGLLGAPDKREQMIDQFVDAMRSLYLHKPRGAAIEAIKRSLGEN